MTSIAQTTTRRSTQLASLAPLASMALLGLLGCRPSSSSPDAPGPAAAAIPLAATTPATSTQQSAPPAITLAPRTRAAAAALKSGELLIVGGQGWAGSASEALRHDPARGGFERTKGQPLRPRLGHAATALSGGEVLISGGLTDAAGRQILADTEIYDPRSDDFRPGPALAAPRSGHAALPYRWQGRDGVLLLGGITTSPAGGPVVQDRIEFLDPAAAAAIPLPRPWPLPRLAAALAVWPTGEILIAGGRDAQGLIADDALLLSPDTGLLTPLPGLLHAPRAGASCLALVGGEYLLAGGGDGRALSAFVEYLDPVARVFRRGPALARPRIGQAAALPLGREALLIGGLDDAGALLASIESIPSAAPRGAPGPFRGVPATAATAPPLSVSAPAWASAVQPLAAAVPSLTGSLGSLVGSLFTGFNWRHLGGGVAGGPQIDALYPAQGRPGDQVTIYGLDFDPDPAKNEVYLGWNSRAQVLQAAVGQPTPQGSPSTLLIEIPPGLKQARYQVTVTVGGYSSLPEIFEIQ